MMIYKLLEKMYRLLNKVIPSDIIQVLYAPKSTISPPKTQASNYNFRALRKEEVIAFSRSESSELSPGMATLIDDNLAICIAALTTSHHNEEESNGELAAYSWFAKGRVDSQYNSGGGRFKGIALSLPPNTRYWFKALVLPEHRGQSLNAWIIFHAANELLSPDCDSIITTTEWTNRAFQKSAQRSGFVKIANAAEHIFLSKHAYRLPDISSKSVHLNGGS